MKGLKRFQVVILLLLGMTLLPSSSAWSFRSDSGGFEQIFPDADGYEYVGGGSGGMTPDWYGAKAERSELQPSSIQPSKAEQQTTVWPLTDLLRFAWMVVTTSSFHQWAS